MSDQEPSDKSEDLTAEQKFKTLGASLKLVRREVERLVKRVERVEERLTKSGIR
jgi:hypothetical protein